MSQQRAGTAIVTDSDGLRGTIDMTSQALQDHPGQVLLQLETGQQVFIPAEELIPHKDGGYTLPFSLSEVAQMRQENMPPPPSQARGMGRNEPQAGAYHEREREHIVMPVVEERLDVRKQRVESGGVRIKKIVHEREEVVDEPLIREEVQVKRVPVGRVVDGPVPVRHIGDTMIISLLEEVLVVEKRLMLKEELHITKADVETYKPQRISLRREEAVIERVDTDEHDDDGGRSDGGGAGGWGGGNDGERY